MAAFLFVALLIQLQLFVQLVTCNPCKDGQLIEEAALRCSASQLINLVQAKTVEVKCGIVLDIIRPCIVAAVSTDHNQTCSTKEKHDLILTFRDTIKQHLKFDVIQCLPVMKCSDFESIMYYLQVACESQFESYVKSPKCENLCSMATCHSNALKTQNKTCSVIDFQNTISRNLSDWSSETGSSKTDICCGNGSSSSLVTSTILYVITFVSAILL